MKKYIILFSSILLFQCAMATTYFVSTTGSNSNMGISDEQPFLTLDYAVKKMVAGDTILMHGGIYEHSVTISLSQTGSNDKK